MPLDIVNKNFSDIMTFSRATSGTYFDSNGILKTAAANEKRFDHDPLTLQPKGLLVEETSVNFLKYSNDLTNEYWVKTNCSVSLGWPSPDGGSNANKITGTSLNNNISQTFTVGPAVPNPCTFSCWIKSASFGIGSYDIKIQMFTGGELVASTTVYPNPWTWTRVKLTGSASASPFVSSSIVIGGDSSLGFNETYYIFGTQLEQGSFASSYIPNSTDNNVVRADDVIEVKVGNWLNDKEGTLFVDSIPANNPLDNILSDRIDSVAFSLYSTKSGDIYTSYHTNLSYGSYAPGESAGRTWFDVKNAGAVQVYLQSISNHTVGINKMIGAYKENDFAFTLNGDTVQTDTQGSVPTLDRARIGNSWYLGRGFTGWIRRIAYYPRRLSNEELQSLTVV